MSAFISAKFSKIAALNPDLILTPSDLQGEHIAAELVRRGWPVYAFNQRSVAEILQMIRVLAGLVGCQDKGHQLASTPCRRSRNRVRRSTALPAVPHVFEEWDEPLISGIQ